MTIKCIQPVFSYDFIAMAFPQQKSSTALNHVIITILVLCSSTCVCGKTNTTLICQLNHCNITVLVLVHNIIHVQTIELPLSSFWSKALYKLLHYHCIGFGQ